MSLIGLWEFEYVDLMFGFRKIWGKYVMERNLGKIERKENFNNNK